jgi:acyl carrier protein
MDTIEQRLRDYIAKNFLFRDDYKFSDDDSFLDMGIIDSTGILELISMLEETYSIRVEDADLVPDNLDSITALGRFVRAKTASTGVCAPEQVMAS